MAPILEARINADLVRPMARPTLREKVLGLGAKPAAGVEMEKYAALVKKEAERFAAVVKAANIKPE